MHSVRTNSRVTPDARNREDLPGMSPSLKPAPPAMLTEFIDRLLLVWHGEGSPSMPAWEQVLDVLSAHRERQIRVFVVTEGGGPSAQQQLRLTHVLGARSLALPVAVISESPRIRFVASTLALFTKRIRTFPPTDLEAAFSFLELNENEKRAAARFVERQRDSGRLGIS